MSLTRAIGNAQSGLSNAGFRADITANNIANAATPGYVRRTAVNAENTVGGQGNGVRISTVERAQDTAISRLRRDADSSLARANTISSIYTKFNQELGQPGDNYGLFSAYEGFESNLRDLAITPESEILQNSVISSAREIVDQFTTLSSFSNHQRTLADASIGRDIKTVNEALYKIQQLNGDITGINKATGNHVALEDERQSLIDTIAQIIPVKDIPREGGQIDIITETGVYLLSGNVKELSFEPAGAISSYDEYTKGSATLSGLFVGEQDLTPNGGGNFSLSSGTLAGHFSVRDTIAPSFSAKLDALAGDLISRLSQDNIDPTKPIGQAGLFTDAGTAFDPLNVKGVAGRLRLNAQIDPSQGGALYRLRDGIGATSEGPSGQSETLNKTLQALTQPFDAPVLNELVGSGSTSELFAALSSSIGEATLRHNALAAGALTRANTLFDAEIETSAVDTDVELQNLLIIEQSYAANARVIQTVSDMLDQLLSL